jgi:serine phosphatase RsbU (regulator of sigma subunit)/glyoxylase-like metal-dependent hydrolase (beta-lactamase superfamily II)
MKKRDYDKAVKISDHVYWVGSYDPSDPFQCNAYLIVVHGNGVIIDPGSVLYFDNFVQKVSEIIELKAISYIVIQHQDPDVCGNIAMFMDRIRSSQNETCTIITHKRTASLIRHYGAHLKYEYSDQLPGQILNLGDEHKLSFIHTPYLHAPGSIATYFNTDRILFSGDLFGGMTEHWDLFADEDYFEQIEAFHREYMPAKELLLFGMTKFERYDIEKIAPQHGSVLDRKQSKSIIEAFKNFECGLFIDQSFRDELQAARKKIEEQNDIMNRELLLAGQFQRSLLPDTMVTKSIKELDIAFLFKPCHQVSGDFLIIEQIDEQHLGVLVVDVVGHGVMPGLATIQVKTLFEEYQTESLSPAAILRIINEKSFSVSENDIFLTALYMVYDTEEAKIHMASAGGVPPIHYDATLGKGRLIQMKGTPLGMYTSGDGEILEESFPLGKDDFVIVQTDGLIECFNKKNEPFDRLKSQKKFMGAIKKSHTSQQVLDVIMEKVTAHKGNERDFDDDVTIVVLKKT